MKNKGRNIVYGAVKGPVGSQHLIPEPITSETRKERLANVIERMKEKNLDVLVVYADREHGANFAYLTGFEPRFEEALLVLHQDTTAYLMLGNENMKMCNYSTIPAAAIHVPYFSLPNQPMQNERKLTKLFEEAGIKPQMHVGAAGWKLFTSGLEENQRLFDLPFYLLEALKQVIQRGSIENATGLFIDPCYGARISVNANEIAHYEFGAALASNCVLHAMNAIAPGKTELDVANHLSAGGQPVSVTTICATGERFEGGVVFPRNKKICLGDKFSLTMGLRGGLTSRAAYVVASEEELPSSVGDYVEILAIPYYRAAVTWYETVGIGVKGKDLYQVIEDVLPQKEYHWVLNPGHLTAEEEWMASPIYPQSEILLKSGMMLQMDIIPGISGYGGVSAEDGIVLADEALRQQISLQYPMVWNRFMRRRDYMIQELGIQLRPEVLPMSDLAGYLRPYLLNHNDAFKQGEKNE